MANTFSQIYVHVIFAVKGRTFFIKEEIREELQKYITGIVAKKKSKMYAIYCMPDHLHMLVSIKPDVSVSDLVRDVKANSSAFIKDKFQLNGFAWQEGLGAFSYAKSQVDTVVNYIANQPQHHKKKSFKEEYFDFLKKYDVQFDEKYVFDFYEQDGR